MVRYASLALILLTTSATWGGEIPRYDIEATCRAAPTLQGNAGNTDRNCIKDETQARTQLGQQWAGFDARQRDECVREAGLGGSPSYVALLTCLQM
ncbi:conserved exported protein of unknown function [Methylorubrum extorquens]|uniref:Uncharacterized protein n=1 Tax=Methylorubrum extorquens TaxID=408 RepID=A0A2N9AXQ3_METEX|nr:MULTISPECIES: hypothetical protein [Methylobacteriaceae]KQO97869.1 hypothetical protein ASF33_07360 [Methylobacterium sp. Leaf92]KQQ13508.1 hypothetical protein ASF56_24540 [Methylobacterium sp. Leaf122]UYW33168.1 hypothetical protein OKB92_03435 [Methylorubrum extorquens]SOR32105.1 conserved exported protein of unknown function [Methylorubrum extorquens]